MSILIKGMEMPTSRDPATGRFLNGHNRYEFLNDPTTAEWKPIEEQGGEAWKDVPGFEGRYKISNHGRIRNRNGIVPTIWNGAMVCTTRIMEQQSSA